MATRSAPAETEEWFVFPREREGNVYSVNWSLCHDGVVPVGDAFRNARLPILTKKLGASASVPTITPSSPLFYGGYHLLEAGDTLPHADFNELFTEVKSYLSSGIELFIEDASLGAYNKVRLGARIVTVDAATALIFRNLLIPSPPRPADHRARFDGWNFDPRFKQPKLVWNGDRCNLQEQTEAEPGQRPVAVFIGDETTNPVAAVQFVESNGSLVGANIVAGAKTPIKGIVEAVGFATNVLVNEKFASAVALPSLSLVKGDKTVLVVNASDEVLSSALESKSFGVFGAYSNVITAAGVTPLFNGIICSEATAATVKAVGYKQIPSVVVSGQTAVAMHPNNLANPVSHIAFFEEGVAKSVLTEADALQKLLNLTDESKTEAIKSILSGVTFSVIGTTKDVVNLF
eukprot:CAMPEP_0170082640 /NCGR_PEP_ID=MMETSP0019_2-20121128/18161_1 /TAXON_ID=98059 /ORGANISM="Dinobryon sp., Strain UTEXLB2267" /LENGTH=403 /DNA_ID=CAMNT_0010297579 /DNA_START=203 /DNA_END=1414 /DNA_ORIENTATION=+